LPIGWGSFQVGWYAWGSYHFRAAQRALADRDFPTARQHLASCLQACPTDSETLLMAAQAARRDGDFAAADRLLRSCLEADGVPEAIDLERKLLRLQGGYLQDAEVCAHFCAANPNAAQTAPVLEALIVGTIRELDLPRAQRCLNLWLERQLGKADQIQGLVWGGDIAIRSGEVGRALACYRQAVEADLRHDAARLRLAELLSRYAPQEALAHLDELLHHRPEDPTLRLCLARCRRALGEHEEARRLLDELLTEKRGSADAVLERGQLELDLGDAVAAEPWLRRALVLAPGKREPNLALARCLHLLGKDAEAKPYQDRVAQIDAVLNPLKEFVPKTGQPLPSVSPPR